MVQAPSTLANGRAGLLDLLGRKARAGPPAVDAVFCSSDVLAHGVLTEALAQGLAVPRDLGVMGFGDLGFSAHVHPALTTVHVDGAAIGAQAAAFVIARVEGRATGARVRDIGFSIVARESA